MSEQAMESQIPAEIIKAYYPENIAGEEVLSGGIVNTTLCVTDAGGTKTILQRLSPIFDESMAQDYEVVSKHLLNEGWEVATAIKSYRGETHTRDDRDRLWRCFSYIESDISGSTQPAIETSSVLSGLLGKLHSSLDGLSYTPKFGIPHFHSTPYYAWQLRMRSAHLPSESVVLASSMLHASDSLIKSCEPLLAENNQLIHGDPKLSNALYRDGKPFTFIDFDTLMQASPLIDVGDLLRSVVGREIASHGFINPVKVDDIIDNYYEEAKPNIQPRVLNNHARTVTKLIASELCMRYLNDVVDDMYFGWDPTTYASRGEHNLARAHAQAKILDAL